MSYTWTFRPLLTYAHLWADGLIDTVYLTVLAIIFGTLLGLTITLALYSPSALFRWLARIYVDIFRAIPALVLLGTLYFCLPILIGFRISPFTTAVVGLTVNLAPFVVECVRSSIESVPRIQYESASVFGLRGWKLQYYIIGPQVLQRVIPPLVGQYITTLKLTSLAAVIGVAELWNVTSQITTITALPLESKITAAALYVAIILPLLWLAHLLEKRFGLLGFGAGEER
jgi:polar amino acid transport system permease protein